MIGLIKKRCTWCLDVIYPKRCLGCDSEGRYCCSSCAKLLIPHSESCPFCHQKSPHYQVCVACKTQAPDIEGIIINFQYTPLSKSLVSKLKRNHAYAIAQELGEKIALLIQTHPLYQKKGLVISYIPSHRIKKYRIKGYNQSECIASHVARLLELPLQVYCKRSRYTRSQVGLSRIKRLSNLNNAFVPTKRDNKKIKNEKIVILIDDITTTGSTINEVARCIKKQQSNIKIRAAVFARHGV